MTTIRQVEQAMFSWAPRDLMMEGDNVGLLVGDGNALVKRALVALDITDSVVNEALERGAELIIAHHPIINSNWNPVQSLCLDNRQGRILTALVRHGIGAMCMHTNLDAADGGINDILAKKLGLGDIEYLSEDKIGRIGTLNCEIPLVEFTKFVVKSLGCNGVRYTDSRKKVRRVAVGGGACGCYIEQAIARGCDTFVTADLKYHQFLEKTELNLIDAGHFPTEDLICLEIVRRMSERYPDVTFFKSTSHCNEVIQYCVKEK